MHFVKAKNKASVKIETLTRYSPANLRNEAESRPLSHPIANFDFLSPILFSQLVACAQILLINATIKA